MFRAGRGASSRAVTSEVIVRSRHKPETTTVNTKRMQLTSYVRLLNAGCPINTVIKVAG